MKNFIKKKSNESERNGSAYSLDKVKADDGYVSESTVEESTDRTGGVEGLGAHRAAATGHANSMATCETVRGRAEAKAEMRVQWLGE
ncbi:hypothetical protein TorRG33x02_134850, partial [Trema orientale]